MKIPHTDTTLIFPYRWTLQTRTFNLTEGNERTNERSSHSSLTMEIRTRCELASESSVNPLGKPPTAEQIQLFHNWIRSMVGSLPYIVDWLPNNGK